MSDSENISILRRSVRDFAVKEIHPHIMTWDETQEFPLPLFKKMGAQGYLGVLVPESYGGVGLKYQDYVTILVELSKVDGAIGLSVAAHNSLCTMHILQHGSEEQKKKYLPKLASGEWIGAWGLTEPNAGSDAVRINTLARKEGDLYVLNGTKNFITHGHSAQVAVVMARTGKPGDPKGISAFIVEKGWPGYRSGKKENKLGMRASETTELIFTDCQLPKNQMMGQEGEGYTQALQILDGGRISIAALSLGIGLGAYNAALEYAKERKQFQLPISSFQGISFKLAEMATQLEAARLLVDQACVLKDNGISRSKHSAMAKFYASETAVAVSQEAVQIFGGYGYTKDFPVEKFYRDAKLCTIGEGTSEIQKMVISKALLQ